MRQPKLQIPTAQHAMLLQDPQSIKAVAVRLYDGGKLLWEQRYGCEDAKWAGEGARMEVVVVRRGK